MSKSRSDAESHYWSINYGCYNRDTGQLVWYDTKETPIQKIEANGRLILTLKGITLINDGVEPELCSLKHLSVDDSMKVILEVGPGTTMLAKLDIQIIYEFSCNPLDRKLLGISWRGHLRI